MSFSFTKENIEEIAETLEAKPQVAENSYTWKIVNKSGATSIMFTIYNKVSASHSKNNDEKDTDNELSMVSAQTQQGFFELHCCTNFLVFDPGEVIFIQSDEKTVTSMIIGKEGTCSLYANIDRKILSSDFTVLDPALLPAAMQLSLLEELI